MLSNYRGSLKATVQPTGGDNMMTSVGLILCVVKLLKAFGLFLAYDVLKVIMLPQFLFVVQLISAVSYMGLQQPLKGKSFTYNFFLKVFKYSFFELVLVVLWGFGLTLCGPVRAMLIFELNEVIVLNAVGSLFSASTGSSKARSRGVLLLVIGVITLLFFDNDNADKLPKHPEGHHTNMLTHWLYSIFAVTGLSDHKIGVLIMIAALFFSVGLRNYQKKFVIEMGGPKALQAVSSCAVTCMLFPGLIASSFTTSDDNSYSWLHIIALLVAVAVSACVVPFYLEGYVIKMDPKNGQFLSTVISIVAALAVGAVWTAPYLGPVQSVTQMGELTEDHLVSAGVVVTACFFVIASFILTAPTKGPARGSFIGYGSDGQPIYSYANQAFVRTTTSAKSVISSGLKQIVSEKDSRQIFYFLCVNLVFTFVELVYGAWTNSLGLISDGFHMLFDCSALCLGLFAAVMSKWKANSEYPYGYGRIEVLSGFVNALFLAVIAFFVLTEAIERVFDPPDVKTDRLLVVSVAGLLVNLFGIFAFHEAHHHAHGGGCSHSHDHGHSHDDGLADNTPTSANTNMKGVFLHVLADTLGSCGVIVSSLLIQYFGWNIADPICSMFIAVMIALSIIPLVTETAKILLNAVPSDMQAGFNSALIKIQGVDGVVCYREPHFWRHSSSLVCATLHVQVEANVSEQLITQQVTVILRDAGVGDIAVQVEKEEFYQHMSGINNSLRGSAGAYSTPRSAMNSL